MGLLDRSWSSVGDIEGRGGKKRVTALPYLALCDGVSLWVTKTHAAKVGIKNPFCTHHLCCALQEKC